MSAVRRGLAGQLWVEARTVYLALIVGGCAGSMGTMHSNPPPVPPVTSFDGSYRNTIHVTDSFGVAQTTSWCDSPGQPVVTVANGQFSYAVPHPNVPGQATPAFPATMAQDGTFYGQVVGGDQRASYCRRDYCLVGALALRLAVVRQTKLVWRTTKAE